MSRPTMIAVVFTLSDRRPIHAPSNQIVLVFAAENYTPERAQTFVDRNAPLRGLRLRHTLGTAKGWRGLLRWSDRYAKRTGRAYPMGGWAVMGTLVPDYTVIAQDQTIHHGPTLA